MMPTEFQLKRDEDAYTTQRPFKGKGLKSKGQSKKESNNQNSFRGICQSRKRRGHFARDCSQFKNNIPGNFNKSKGSINQSKLYLNKAESTVWYKNNIYKNI